MFTFVEMFRPYLFGHKFIIQIHHQALVAIFADKHASDSTNKRILRWRERMQEYQFGIQYIKGKDWSSRSIVQVPPPTISYCEIDKIEFWRKQYSPTSLIIEITEISTVLRDQDQLDKGMNDICQVSLLQ